MKVYVDVATAALEAEEVHQRADRRAAAAQAPALLEGERAHTPAAMKIATPSHFAAVGDAGEQPPVPARAAKANTAPAAAQASR